jgi:hypothetical protein
LVSEEATAIVALEIGLEVAIVTFGKPYVGAVLEGYAEDLSREHDPSTK